MYSYRTIAIILYKDQMKLDFDKILEQPEFAGKGFSIRMLQRNYNNVVEHNGDCYTHGKKSGQPETFTSDDIKFTEQLFENGEASDAADLQHCFFPHISL